MSPFVSPHRCSLLRPPPSSISLPRNCFNRDSIIILVERICKAWACAKQGFRPALGQARLSTCPRLVRTPTGGAMAASSNAKVASSKPSATTAPRPPARANPKAAPGSHDERTRAPVTPPRPTNGTHTRSPQGATQPGMSTRVSPKSSPKGAARPKGSPKASPKISPFRNANGSKGQVQVLPCVHRKERRGVPTKLILQMKSPQAL